MPVSENGHSDKHIEFIDKKVNLGFDCPLDLHCDYTTDVIMAAFGYFNEEKGMLLIIPPGR